jgi:hypothetical protein
MSHYRNPFASRHVERNARVQDPNAPTPNDVLNAHDEAERAEAFGSFYCHHCEDGEVWLSPASGAWKCDTCGALHT